MVSRFPEAANWDFSTGRRVLLRLSRSPPANSVDTGCTWKPTPAREGSNGPASPETRPGGHGPSLKKHSSMLISDTRRHALERTGGGNFHPVARSSRRLLSALWVPPRPWQCLCPARKLLGGHEATMRRGGCVALYLLRPGRRGISLAGNSGQGGRRDTRTRSAGTPVSKHPPSVAAEGRQAAYNGARPRTVL